MNPESVRLMIVEHKLQTEKESGLRFISEREIKAFWCQLVGTETLSELSFSV